LTTLLFFLVCPYFPSGEDPPRSKSHA
jgi:hypothetical protein